MQWILTLFLSSSAYGADLYMTREGEYVRVGTTNNTFRAACFEYKRELSATNWSEYQTLTAGPGEGVAQTISFKICVDEGKLFWRLRNRMN